MVHTSSTYHMTCCVTGTCICTLCGCRANLHDQDIPGAHQVNAQGMQLNVYSSGDIVSTSISRSQSWEPAIIHQLQWAISQYKPNTVSTQRATNPPERARQAPVCTV
jgi:hypothetical protein